jgi:hypothetical protein
VNGCDTMEAQAVLHTTDQRSRGGLIGSYIPAAGTLAGAAVGGIVGPWRRDRPVVPDPPIIDSDPAVPLRKGPRAPTKPC